VARPTFSSVRARSYRDGEKVHAVATLADAKHDVGLVPTGSAETIERPPRGVMACTRLRSVRMGC